MSVHEERAKELFLQGYNCSQAVFAAFCDVTGLDFDTALLISSPFGGGLSRLREVCGAFSGLSMAVGMLYGYNTLDDKEEKMKLYKRIQEMAEEARKRNGSYLCYELLGLPHKRETPVPQPRTEEYYKKRPCLEIIGETAKILDDYIKTQNKPDKEGANKCE